MRNKKYLKMEKLELKRVAQHIGCGVVYNDTHYILDGVQLLANGNISLICWDALYDAYGIHLPVEDCKLVLHPLSDLTKEITHNGETFVPINELKYFYGFDYLWSYVTNPQGYFNAKAVCLASIDKLLEWNFDIDDLIGKHLAEDINTLNNE